MKSVCAFDFDNLKDLLKFQVEMSLLGTLGRKTSNLSKVAKKLGYRSPSTLTMLLKGQRIPTDEMVGAMVRSWKLGQAEREFLQLLVQVEREKKKGKDPTDTLERLKKLAAKKSANSFVVSLNQFSLVKDWYYLVVKQLVASPDFSEDPKWISKKLRRKITPQQVERALEVLQELKLIERDSVSGKLVASVGSTETTHDVPSEFIRMHHQGMLDRAKEALEEQSVQERHFNSLTVKVDAKRLPEIKEKILEFVRELNKEFETDNSNRVYQLNVHLFEHTRDIILDPTRGDQ
jgi:uncharacterized protein (TIGR02147 family)